jgi:uncharacterized protein (TIGR01620 family)
MTSVTTTLYSFPSTLSRAWTWGRRLLWTLGIAFTVIIVLEAIHLHRLLDSIHPVIAWTVTGLLGAALVYWGGRAAWRYLRTPRVIAPPELPASEEDWSAKHREAYRDFAVRYLERQAKNPHLPATERSRIGGAIETIRSIAGDSELVEPVRREVDAVLEPLDRTARSLIRRTAVEVSIATAVSPSILLDSLITLAHNMNLISKLADLYYGRPGLFGTLRVARDVFGAAVAAGALEVVSDNLTAVASEVTGSWSTRLLGPLGQGAVNGVVTMRLGAAARARCRSLSGSRIDWRPWRVADYRKAVSRLIDWVSEDVGPRFTGPFTRMFRGSETGEAEESAESVKEGWWKRIFRRAPTEVPTEDGGTDPLLDSDLFDESKG